LINRRLTALGYDITLSFDGVDALKKFEKDEFDLVIVDYHLPKLKGIDVITRLAALDPIPSMIMLTPIGDEKTAVTALKLGALDYIVKDLQGGFLELLPLVIMRVLEKKKLIDGKREAEEALKRAYTEVEQKVKDRTRELSFANEELRSLDQMRRNLVANISHELLTPLTVIKGSNEILLSKVLGELSPRVIELLQASQEKVGYLVSLVDNVLILQKAENPPQEYRTEKYNVIDILENVVTHCNFEICRKKLNIERKYDKKVLYGLCNPQDFGKIIENIFTNAVKFSNSDSRIILAVTQNDSTIKISVRDFGIGIPEQEHARIFERFYQVDTSLTRRYGGAGLGLAICKELISLQKGTLGVESAPEKGSEFYVTIPVWEEAEEVKD
jgi:signal transduction histidine kinase